MNLKLETEFSKAPILQEVDALKKQIDDMRPLPEDLEGRVMQKLRLDWNYHSNAIEGNKLNYGETVAFLMEGITAKGKPLKDHLDIRGHNEAINFLLSIVKDARPISESEIRSLHKMILVEPYDVSAQTADGLPTTKRITLGEYKTSANHVRTATGEMHYYATPEETPAKMQELMEWYSEVNNNEDIHPIVTAALFHHKFVSIHPFDDGNGRLSRILMNLILMQKGYPPVVIKMDDRTNYYSLLSRADNGDGWPFVEYIAVEVERSFQLYLKAANGDDIDEDEDIDKEIALFKAELLGSTNVKYKKSLPEINRILVSELSSLAQKLISKVSQFEDVFFDISNSVVLMLQDKATPKVYSSVENILSHGTQIERDNILNAMELITIAFNFKKFKNINNDFDIITWVAFTFNDYNYSILLPNGFVLLSKLYRQPLTNSEMNSIVKGFISELTTAINEKLKKPGVN
ncbi:Fic family protein [Mucilaginibacter sp. ZT4R22]|uniref:Fic family protein n=1 Tax=Mucilaginibacter pankratovii TaxID=2772110 RepID=A0ABR7WVU2_9SPHI|nr:Fic family protein [Mucilaginibacter pankratovii]MBD1366406.1 Fic family protein [Mucilaginibacter pankratovii]